jgi:2,3-bisphosphoglycerate-dependent phosphoglycerate mutase
MHPLRPIRSHPVLSVRLLRLTSPGIAFAPAWLTMSGDETWPSTVWIVRHGESAGNVARQAAYLARKARIDINLRDIDVPLSPLGERQARALGHWFGKQPEDSQPTAVLTSPYIRALHTAELVRESAGWDAERCIMTCDERLREKEFGILDRFTRHGIAAIHPEQEELRLILGKFYHRPPGGESWCDVILRLRSVLDTLTREYSGERVLIVCHSVVVLCFRYLLERMSEQQILDVDRLNEVANCSVTRYERDPIRDKRYPLALREYNMTVPLVEEGAQVTTEPDARAPAP